MDKLPRAAAIGLAVFLFFTTAYRARTQSITIDEAYTYSRFVARPLGDAMSEYDANNHMLYTLLARGSTGVFGASDLTLRLPALAGALLFFFALFRLCAGIAAAGAPWLLPAGMALIGANTYLLDHFPLARGYGLALGLFTFALSLLAGDEGTPARRAVAGAALGLAVAANLTLLFPVLALIAGLILLDRQRAWRCAGVALAVAAAVLAAPLSQASRDHFYFGTNSLSESLASLVGASLTHNWTERGGPVPTGSVLAAVVLTATAIAGLSRWRTGPRSLLLTASIILGSALLIVTSHLGAGLPYPFGRTGLYWILLFGVGVLALGALFRRSGGQLLALAVTACAVYWYVDAWSTRFTTDWQFDAATRELAEKIEAQHRAERGREPVRVGASSLLRHSLDFYRVTRNWTWMAPVEGGEKLRQEPLDYYLVIGEDFDWVKQQPQLKVIGRSDVADSILARR